MLTIYDKNTNNVSQQKNKLKSQDTQETSYKYNIILYIYIVVV